jgi:hypothetical protein
MTLLEEIKSKCTGAPLANYTLTAIVATVNANRIRVGKVERADFAMWSAGNGMRAKIEDHANDLHSPIRSIALACRDLILGAANSIDFGLAQNVAMLQAWVAVGALSQADADSLLALATQPNPITEFDVRCALWDVHGNWLGG